MDDLIQIYRINRATPIKAKKKDKVTYGITKKPKKLEQPKYFRLGNILQDLKE